MKRGSLFYKIFIPISVIGIALVIGFSSYIYLSTLNTMDNRITDNKIKLIFQIRNTLDQKIQTTEYTLNTYSTTNSFRHAVNNPITEQDFEAYREVNTQLKYIETLGMEGVQYSIISLVHNWKISEDRLSYITEEEHARLFDQYIDKRMEGIYWTITESGIRFVNPLPVFSHAKQAIAFVDIPYSSIEQAIQGDQTTAFYILNKNGELLYQSKAANVALKPAELKTIAEQADEAVSAGVIELHHDNNSMQKAAYSKSDYNSWTYVTLLDKHEITPMIRTTGLGLSLLSIVLILFIVLMSYFIAMKYTLPIRKIQLSLPERPDQKRTNEFDWILDSIDSMRNEKERIESLLEKELPQLETQFIMNLIRNRITADEITVNMKRFGYDSGFDIQYVTLLIQLDQSEDHQAGDKDLLLLAVARLTSELIPANERMLPIVLNDRTQATLLMFTDKSEQEIRASVLQYAKQLIQSTREYLNASISIGVSEPYNYLMDTKEATEMSKQALYYRLNMGKESIIFYDDISTVTSNSIVRYPVELESQLFDAIRLADVERVTESIYMLLGEFMKRNKSANQLEVAIMRLVNNLIQLEQRIGTEVLLTGGSYTVYHRLLQIRNPEEIERILIHEVVFPMVHAVKDKTSRQFHSLANQIATIIRTEFDQELTLDAIGERLHYNPDYLSSIFKKEFGVSFSEYLISYRLDIAKKWLAETDLTIKEISERLQYQNSQNFIRSFRKKEHVTPGEYRKSKQIQ